MQKKPEGIGAGDRRTSLKSLAAGLVAVGSYQHWSRPVVRSIILPAHADASFAASCEINFSRETQLSKNSSSPDDEQIEGVYVGTLPGAAPDQGSCADTVIGFDSLPLTITVTPVNGA